MIIKLRYALWISIASTFILGFFFPNQHPHFWWQKLPVFDVFFGFFGCILIIVFAKWVGHNWLMKDRDYYDRN
ncbi:MAG: hypothetical protein JXO49_07140 [Deltaproteobacteria bacterium]|nr:hypothetical protein [Candidatus Anaeroferrophillus wilburensis]MBN2889103.1 hypothetical protein [Deltaproteobacteria bacterium]